jgi:hypothetical protein
VFEANTIKPMNQTGFPRSFVIFFGKLLKQFMELLSTHACRLERSFGGGRGERMDIKLKALIVNGALSLE